jgi:lantibiotic biosynthesis protein
VRQEGGRSPLVPSGFFALRTPLLPFRELVEWAEGLEAPEAPDDPGALARDRRLLRSRLRLVVKQPAVREAIFVASPQLEGLVDVWAEDPESARGAGCERALVRYLQRMAGRATPFGLFAGTSTGAIGDTTALTVDGSDGYTRHTRLDATWLVEVLDRWLASPETREATLFIPNPSLYQVGDRHRYVRSRPKADERRHVLLSVHDSPALRAALATAAEGATPAVLAGALVEQGEEAERASPFADDLIEQQVLVPTLDLQLTGSDAVYGLAEAIPPLAAAREELARIDASGLGIPPDRYRRVAARLDGLIEKPRLDHMFHVDLRKGSPDALLGTDIVEEIRRGTDLLRRVGSAGDDERLQRFVERFRERYEGRSVPLLEALDPDVGVGFDDDAGGAAQPLEGLGGGRSRPPMAEWGRREEHLLRRLLETQAAGSQELVLGARDLELLERRDAPPLADACAAIAVVAAPSEPDLARGRFRVLLLSVQGPSGATLLGRFCDADERLRASVEEHLRAEEALDPEAVYAEIVHLPRAVDVNVVARPVLREYEIACLGRPGAPPSRRLTLDDLVIAVEEGRVVVSSRRLGRRVVPRLTSAHNHRWRGVAAYRFLCQLIAQGSAGGFDFWGPLAAAPWLPRVRRGRVVLQRAQWQLSLDELEAIEDKDKAFRDIQAWRALRSVPRFALLITDGPELPVDFDNVLSVDALAHTLRSQGYATLVEMYPGPDELCARGPEGAFVHQLVVPFVRQEPRPAVAPRRTPPRRVTRTFPPGSEWLYARVYVGRTTADAILSTEVAPLVRGLLASGAADSWFFLRYADPEFHLRIRFHGDVERLIREARPRVEEVGARLLEQGVAWRIEFGTYEREVERYGGSEAIELAERIFCVDSDAVLAILPLLEPGRRGQEERWRIALCGAHLLLVDLGLDIDDRLMLVRRRAAEIAADRGWSDGARGRIGRRFRQERALLEQLLEPESATKTGLELGLAVLGERSSAIEPLGVELARLEGRGRLTTSLSDVAASLVHMHLNRLLRGDNTAQEAVICNFLARLYEGQTRSARRGS